MERGRPKVLEVSGRDVDEAVADGLSQLGLSSDEVSVEIVSHARRGLLGLGSEPARVRITYPAPEEGTGEWEVETAEEEDVASATEEVEDAASSTEEVVHIVQATVQELLERMGIQAQATVRHAQADQLLTLEIVGEDLTVLTERHGEALNALQYMARLVVSRELLRWVPFVLDAEGYRNRRARELDDLARRMAERVALSKQALALEAMPAHERRIIHIALRDHPLVSTESVGQGENRRITILPRR